MFRVWNPSADRHGELRDKNEEMNVLNKKNKRMVWQQNLHEDVGIWRNVTYRTGMAGEITNNQGTQRC